MQVELVQNVFELFAMLWTNTAVRVDLFRVGSRRRVIVRRSGGEGEGRRQRSGGFAQRGTAKTLQSRTAGRILSRRNGRRKIFVAARGRPRAGGRRRRPNVLVRLSAARRHRRRQRLRSRSRVLLGLRRRAAGGRREQIGSGGREGAQIGRDGKVTEGSFVESLATSLDVLE